VPPIASARELRVVVWLYTIISVVIISAVSLIGVITLGMRGEKLQKITLFLVSFAVGGLFGDALIHLLPESFKHDGSTLPASLFVVAGILVFFVLEKFLRWRHCHLPGDKHVHPVVTMNLVGEGVHNFIDGVLVGASYLVSVPLGIATSLAIIMHEIPKEFGGYCILIHGGLSRSRALVFNFFCGLGSVIGAIAALTIGSQIKGFADALIPITAGGFLYIAGSDLIPELQHDTEVPASLGQFAGIILGVGIMALMLLSEGLTH
jgi:zinc and cadmium transporter